MSFHVWCGSANGQPEFEHTHEESAARDAIGQLRHHYNESQDFCHLGLNLHCNGRDLDALVLKHNAIIVIEFKDCAAPIQGAENGAWAVVGDNHGTLNEGRHNPFQQVRSYRYAVRQHLHESRCDFLPQQKAAQATFDHVSGVVCVSPDLHQDSQIDVNQGGNRWFHIVGLPGLGDLVLDIRSTRISLTDAEARRYVEDVLTCSAYQDTEGRDAQAALQFSKPEPYDQWSRAARFMDEAGKTLKVEYGSRIPTGAIQRYMKHHGGYERGSVLPTDYCYNRMNRAKYSFRYHVFRQDSRGWFEYLGPNHNHTGPILWKDRDGTEKQVGEWQSGSYGLWEDPRRNAP